jgi:hypothetical protein
MPDGWQFWRRWQLDVAPDNRVEIEALTEDRGRCLGYARAVARPELAHDAGPGDHAWR